MKAETSFKRFKTKIRKDAGFRACFAFSLVIVCSLGAYGATEDAKLFASDGRIEDRFGKDVAVYGDTIVVGARWDDDNGQDSGSAYVFERIGGVWSQTAKLVANDGVSDAEFGRRVAIYNDTIVIGARYQVVSGVTSGAAYVYQRVGGSWNQVTRLLAGDTSSLAGVDLFGDSVSVFETTIAVGARANDEVGENTGSVYLYDLEMGSWNLNSKVTVGDARSGDHFGASVFLYADTLIVGAPFDDIVSFSDQAGSAYIFRRNGIDWIEEDKLIALNPLSGDYMGFSVSIFADTAVVGVQQSHINLRANEGRGRALVFSRVGGAWIQQSELAPHDLVEGERFGHTVSVYGENLVIGSLAVGSSIATKVYLFSRAGNDWIRKDTLDGIDVAFNDNYGTSVAIWENTVVVGAELHNHVDHNDGAAYVFSVPLSALPIAEIRSLLFLVVVLAHLGFLRIALIRSREY